jgi:ketosteroid isomerase-like protein
MRKPISALALAAVILSSGCNETNNGSKEEIMPSANVKTINVDELSTKFSTAWNAKDSTALMELMSNDVVMNNTTLHIKGKDSIATRWIARNLRPTNNLTMIIKDKEANSDLAYESGSWSLDVVLPGKPTSKSSGSYTFAWKKQADNNWKIRLMSIENEK